MWLCIKSNLLISITVLIKGMIGEDFDNSEKQADICWMVKELKSVMGLIRLKYSSYVFNNLFKVILSCTMSWWRSI